ncbi:MMPL family transporter [Dactylosporangium roseum]|uniref:MMPL family transporter n=1 Tax=Dactylosporangium roseum TaxID=47989 RepID=A0ABY5Z4X4_9ACTN|nr:MMPL family transporter [Dactylosporangium roseum]UWZ37101.1 MMPL family transporter [Dactylosporangium roseum]
MAQTTQTERTTSTSTVFTRLADRSYRHRWLALIAWVAVLVAVTVAAQVVGSDYRNDFALPGTDSQRALDMLRERAPAQAGATAQVVVQRADGLAARPTRDRIEAMLRDVRELPRVAEVRSPYEDPSAMSRDGTVAYATVVFDAPAEQVPGEDVRRIMDTAQAARGDGLRVELGGDPVRNAQESEGGAAEGVGMLAALVILVLLFGSLLAASLPIVIAVFAVGSAVGVVALASHLATIADFTAPLMLLVGLGVGIDYALLVFSRYRGELLAGADRAAATRTALDTAGRTVFFAGCTVIVALLGLIALGLGSLRGVAVAIAVTVLVTMIASLTLLPALLAVVGARVERGVRKRASRAIRREGDRWRAWSTLVQRRPWAALVLAVGALLALAWPTLDMRLGFADAGTDAPSATSRAAYDLLAEGFGAGFNGPLVVVVRGDTEAAATVQQALSTTAGVAATTPPLPSSADLSTIIVFPDAGPQDARTAELVDRLRSQTLPPLAAGSGATLLVGGSTAAVVDFADAVSGRLPIFVGLVVGLSALLLLLVFRSVLIPIKAALLNLLSVAAAMGAITLVFQDGRFGAQPGPIEAYVPVMIFAIAFGLSMDYEVFLLARMHEEWQRTRDAQLAIREGLATTGRIVTAAAAIMVLVFGSFLLDPGRMLQQFGLGLAVAVLLDALVIRCLIVPAVMRLLGTRAWWLPRWLDRSLPHVALEAGPADGPVPR